MAAIGGGCNNLACEDYATVAGGQTNTAIYYWATVGGGCGNTASGCWSTIGGGNVNTASGKGSVIAGGVCNRTCGLECVSMLGSSLSASDQRRTYTNDLEVYGATGATIAQTFPSYIYLYSPNGTKYKANIADGGSWTITAA